MIQFPEQNLTQEQKLKKFKYPLWFNIFRISAIVLVAFLVFVYSYLLNEKYSPFEEQTRRVLFVQMDKLIGKILLQPD